MGRLRIEPSPAIGLFVLVAWFILGTSETLGGGLCQSPADCGNGDPCHTWQCERVVAGAPGLCRGPGTKDCNDGDPETIDYCNSIDGGACVHERATVPPTPQPTPTPQRLPVGDEIARIAISCGPSTLPNSFRRYCTGDCTRSTATDPAVCRFGEQIASCSPAPPNTIQACCYASRRCANVSCESAATEFGFAGECFTTFVQYARIVQGDGFSYEIAYCAVYHTEACPTPTATPRPCQCDCDSGGSVTVDELVLAVNIALDHSHVSTCVNADLNGDGGVKVNELVAAVGVALNGCGI